MYPVLHQEMDREAAKQMVHTIKVAESRMTEMKKVNPPPLSNAIPTAHATPASPSTSPAKSASTIIDKFYGAAH
jgi:hypothetical protein